MKYIKWILLTLVVILLSTALFFGYKLKDANITQPRQYKDYDQRQVEEMNTVNPFSGNQPLRILAMGIDKTGTTELDEDHNPKRSDVNILVTIDPVQKKVQLLSLPRDTYVEIPGRADKTKLGHAYAFGGEELAIQTVEKFLDTHIDFYATVDYEAVKKLIDAMGGIKMDIPFDYHYEDPSVIPPLVIDFKKGEQMLNGEEAVKYLRIRKLYKDQDIGRIQAQQGFLMMVFDQMKKPTMIFKLPHLIDIASENIKTDLTYGQMAYIAKFALSLSQEDIESDILVGEDKRLGQPLYYVVDQETAQMQLKRFLEGKGPYYQEVNGEYDAPIQNDPDKTQQLHNTEEIEHPL